MQLKINVNKSKVYFTPLFNEVVPIAYFNLLQNTYFWYDDFKEETFCLLYKFDGRVKGKFQKRSGFTVYEQTELTQSKLFKGYRDFGEYVIYEFELTDELLDYRNILLEGKYSKLSEKAKQTILSFSGEVYGPNEKNHIKKVLYKDEELLQEVADKFNVNIKYVTEALSKIIPERELFANSVIETKQREDEIKRISEGSTEN